LSQVRFILFNLANAEKILTQFPSTISIDRNSFDEVCEKLQISAEETAKQFFEFENKIILDGERVAHEVAKVLDIGALKTTTSEKEAEFVKLNEKFQGLDKIKKECEDAANSKLKIWKFWGLVYVKKNKKN
jgi:hypothetical protein